MRKFIVFIIFSIVFSACSKHEMTIYSAYWINNTDVVVKVYPYVKGYISDSLIINVNEEVKIAEGTERGVINNRFFYSEFFESADDSVIVVFNNLDTVVHYFVTPSDFSEKSYPYNSPRNIYNRESYEFEMIRKKGNYNIHRYYFTESDYEYAKD